MPQGPQGQGQTGETDQNQNKKPKKDGLAQLLVKAKNLRVRFDAARQGYHEIQGIVQTLDSWDFAGVPSVQTPLKAAWQALDDQKCGSPIWSVWALRPVATLRERFEPKLLETTLAERAEGSVSRGRAPTSKAGELQAPTEVPCCATEERAAGRTGGGGIC